MRKEKEFSEEYERRDDSYETMIPKTDQYGAETARPDPEKHNHNIDKLQESIHKSATSTSEIDIDQHIQGNPSNQYMPGVQRELKTNAYEQTIGRVRGDLSAAERAFSKLIHNKVIEPFSEAGARSVARPSGILGGGIAALIGSSAVLYMAKYYGFRYNFTVFFLLLGLGFLAGLIAELGLRFIKK